MDHNGKYLKRMRKQRLINEGVDPNPRPWTHPERKIMLTMVLHSRPGTNTVIAPYSILVAINRPSWACVTSEITRLVLNLRNAGEEFIESGHAFEIHSRDKAWYNKREFDILVQWIKGKKDGERRFSKVPGGHRDFLPLNALQLGIILGRSELSILKKEQDIIFSPTYEEKILTGREKTIIAAHRRGFGLIG